MIKVQQNLKPLNSFIVFNIDSVNVSDCLVFDIFIKRDNNYLIIIKAGTTLSSSLYEKLKKQDKLFIKRENIDKHKLSCKSLQDHIFYAKDNIEKEFDYLYKINNMIFTDYLASSSDAISLECVEDLVKSIIFLIHKNENFLKEVMPFFVNNNELANHSLNVSIYSLSLGNVLKLSNHELLQLGIAGLLHDLGIKSIDSTIIDKDKKLSLSELESIHQHPSYSTKIIKKNEISDPYIIDAVAHHHENYDGTGYPEALTGKEISKFASIISIADVFDALTNIRPNREAYNSFSALKIMMKDEAMVNKFNYLYLKQFLTLI